MSTLDDVRAFHHVIEEVIVYCLDQGRGLHSDSLTNRSVSLHWKAVRFYLHGIGEILEEILKRCKSSRVEDPFSQLEKRIRDHIPDDVDFIEEFATTSAHESIITIRDYLIECIQTGQIPSFDDLKQKAEVQPYG